MNDYLKDVLTAVKDGTMTVEEAAGALKTKPFVDIGYAKLDTHRKLRCGVGEVVYGKSKTAEQIAGIVSALVDCGQKEVLVTGVDGEKAASVLDLIGKNNQSGGGQFYKEAGLLVFGGLKKPDGTGKIVVATGGTSDMPVAEQAAVTAEFLGNEVVRLYDVGVEGLHRLLSYLDDLTSASVVIAVAGMEGALASVIGGLVDCPVIAVPTSVGYGACFKGLSALLAMMNSCSSGVAVVNIDNGFGAGYLASTINHMGKNK